MKPTEYGYVRVSSKEQNTDRQFIAMEAVGVERRHIFVDKQSGKDFNRPKYRKLLRKVKPGDTIFIKSIDRLGRNYDEIIDQWALITRQKDVNIVVIDFPLLDTRNEVNGLTGKFIADLVLQVLSYVAQIERENIRQRQAEGIEAAKAKGVRFGRSAKEIPEHFEEIYKMWQNNEITGKEAGNRLGVDYKTFKKWRIMKEEED